MYTTHTHASDTNIHVYIHVHTLNPMESSYRDGPADYKNIYRKRNDGDDRVLPVDGSPL